MRSIHNYYFMENNEWFIFDEENDIMILTDKAPKEAKVMDSYNEYLHNRQFSYNCLFADLENVDIENDTQIEHSIQDITKK